MHQGDLILSTEDELGNDNGTSTGYLRTDRKWHRFNAGRANAHQQGQDRFGKRWFAGSYDNANPNSAPWIRWSDDLGKTQTKAPKGSLTLNEPFKKGGLISRFFEFDGEFFANSFQDGLNILHYTGRDDDPFEMTYEKQSEWVPNSRYSTIFKSWQFKGYLFGTVRTRSWAAYRWSPVTKQGRYRTYTAPGNGLMLAAPKSEAVVIPEYDIDVPAEPGHPDQRRRVCRMVTKHGYLWAIFSDQSQTHPDNDGTVGGAPVSLIISRTSDGDNWDDLYTMVVSQDDYMSLAVSYPAPV